MAASSRPAQENRLRGEAQKPCRQAGLFAIQECILFGATIYFAHELTLIQFTRLIKQASQARATGAEMASTAINAQSGSLNATSRFRAPRNIAKQIGVFLSEARACAHWVNGVEEFAFAIGPDVAF
jgi:hypothetical protein